MKKTELPLGFGMALAQNESAMHRFESLPDSQKTEIIKRSHNVNSKSEMQNLVDSLLNNSDNF